MEHLPNEYPCVDGSSQNGEWKSRRKVSAVTTFTLLQPKLIYALLSGSKLLMERLSVLASSVTCSSACLPLVSYGCISIMLTTGERVTILTAKC
jgi:hypothetical protein